MPGFDIYDQAVLTALVNEEVDTALEQTPFLGEQIAPLSNLAARMARMDVGRTYSFGIGQFKAPNAMPALVEMPVTERREALIEMVQLEEMHRINSEQWIRLQSSDENIRNAEGLDVVERGRILRRRLERLTEWMRWQAFVNGSLTITYPRTNSPARHRLRLALGPQADLAGDALDRTRPPPIRWRTWRRWQQLIADDSGHLGTLIHLTSAHGQESSLNNASLKTLLQRPGRSGRSGPRWSRWRRCWQRARSSSSTTRASVRWRRARRATRRRTRATCPNNKVVITTDYQIEGENIADTLNGQVEIGVAYNDTAIQMGPSSEVILDHMTKNRYLREAAARIVRIIHPECFVSRHGHGVERR